MSRLSFLSLISLSGMILFNRKLTRMQIALLIRILYEPTCHQITKFDVVDA
jgi:hypothetical protein